MRIGVMTVVLAACALCACEDPDVIYIDQPCERWSCDPVYCGDKCDRFASADEADGPSNQIDADGDTLPNYMDNCIDVPNVDQKDSDGNGLGDACDTGEAFDDTDGDTIIDLKDNCRHVPNFDQADSDGDGLGDVCDDGSVIDVAGDLDGDTGADQQDNCPRLYNPGQEDLNRNGVGDACEAADESDRDGDTVPDVRDNCPDVGNSDQKDSNHNGIGDACETVVSDRDGDTVPDVRDNCPDVGNPDQKDSNHNGIGDSCDAAVAELEDGSPEHPFLISGSSCELSYRHAGDTSKSDNYLIDVYPTGSNQNESGPEYYYKLEVSRNSRLSIYLDPEPSGVDIDIHLLKNVDIAGNTIPQDDFLSRSDKALTYSVEAGTYWIVADTFVSNGVMKKGRYVLNVQVSPEYSGTKDDPIQLNCGNALPGHYAFSDTRSTVDARSNIFDAYPGHMNISENGPEFIYKFEIREKSWFHANIRKPEPKDTDIDIHLLKSLSPDLIERSDARIWRALDPGTYYLTADTYENKRGKFILDIQTRPYAVKDEDLFNDYMLKAVNYLEKNWARRGHNISGVYTHDLSYGSYGTVTKSSYAPQTMCVAAVAEIILVAMDIYAQETGDTSVWDHLPLNSWTSLNDSAIKAHIWVNYALNAGGTGDAVTAFGMGMNVPFKELRPGSVANINREKTGHAVVFLSFLDKNCQEVQTYNDNVIGFKYYSSQGNETNGGFDYRYLHFYDTSFARNCPGSTDVAKYAKPEDQVILNTGMIYHPKHWTKTSRAKGENNVSAPVISYFNKQKFNGITEPGE